PLRGHADAPDLRRERVEPGGRPAARAWTGGRRLRLDGARGGACALGGEGSRRSRADHLRHRRGPAHPVRAALRGGVDRAPRGFDRRRRGLAERSEGLVGDLSLGHFVVLGGVLFALGLFCVLTRRNAIGILMGIELVLNSANINYVAFARYNQAGYDGQVFAIFVIMLAAAEAAIGLAIVLGIYQRFETIDVEATDRLRQ